MAFAVWQIETGEAYLRWCFSLGVEESVDILFGYGRSASLQHSGRLERELDGMTVAPTHDTERLLAKLRRHKQRGEIVLIPVSGETPRFEEHDVLLLEAVSVRRTPGAAVEYSETRSSVSGRVWSHACRGGLTVSCMLPSDLGPGTRDGISWSALRAVERRLGR